MINIRADSILDYLTGAASDGAVQNNQALSLGSFRASAEWGGLAMYIENAINNLTVDFASGANDLGENILECLNANTIQWAGGNAIQIEDGESVIAEGSTPGKYIRVTRTSDNDLQMGQSTVTLTSPLNNVIGFNNVSHVVATAGGSYYRGIIAKNRSSGSIYNFKRWIPTIAASNIVSDVARLSGAGPGTITSTTGVTDWPESGYAHIFNGGSSREIVYYSSRTGNSLTVTGRALLGTSASAGLNTDIVVSVPGIAIAKDVAGVTNAAAIATIANETTAPAGVTWNTGIDGATGLQIGTMAANQQIGIWIWKHIPPGAYLSLGVLDKINSSFDG